MSFYMFFLLNMVIWTMVMWVYQGVDHPVFGDFPVRKLSTFRRDGHPPWLGRCLPIRWEVQFQLWSEPLVIQWPCVSGTDEDWRYLHVPTTFLGLCFRAQFQGISQQYVVRNMVRTFLQWISSCCMAIEAMDFPALNGSTLEGVDPKGDVWQRSSLDLRWKKRHAAKLDQK